MKVFYRSIKDVFGSFFIFYSFLFIVIFIVSLIKSLSWNKTLKSSVCEFCALIGFHCKKVHTKCAKPVDEKKKKSVRDFKPKIFIKGVHPTHFEKKCSIESWFFLSRKVYILFMEKSKNSTCHRSTFYSIFNMSSCKKPEIQNYWT